MQEPLRLGIIGGGFIGRVHARAAQLDGAIRLVAGALSSDREKAARIAAELAIPADRAYASWPEMLARERARADRVDLVAVCTPNDMHLPVARGCLEAGLAVVCEKPLTRTLAEAQQLAESVRGAGAPLALMHNYTGYPLVRQARAMVEAGELGDLIAVRATYLQGSAWRAPEVDGQPRAAWRGDPRRTGPAGALGDIGSHAYNLVRFVTQAAPESVSCALRTFTPGRKLDDYGAAHVALAGGALATLVASKVSHGRENDLSIHVEGTKGSLEWRQEEPNALFHRVTGQPLRVLTRDSRAQWMHASAKAAIRLPAGHPEAFHEAFANVYAAFAPDVRAWREKRALAAERLYPDLTDGVDEMRFLERALASAGEAGAWKRMA